MKERRFVAVMVVLAVLLGGIALTAAAEPLAQSGSEPEASITMESAPMFVIGDAPDTDGYTGPVVQAHGIETPSEILVEETPDWERFFLEPQLDEDAGAVKVADIGIAWSNFYYTFVAGSTFRPRASATTWGYPGAGCVHVAAGGDLFTLPLNLPQGSRLDYLRLYYYDTSANNSKAWITRYDASGVTTDLISVDSAGNTGYGTTLSAYSGHIVDNMNNTYVLNWWANQTGTTMRLCGMRVAYRLP